MDKVNLMAYVGWDEAIVFLPEQRKEVEKEFFEDGAGRYFADYDLKESSSGYMTFDARLRLNWY